MCQNFGMPAKSSRKSQRQDASSMVKLSRRERQIMDVLYRLGQATAAEIHAAVPDPPSYTAIRSHLTLLERKKHVKHGSDGTRYIYSPVVPREEMGQQAIEGVLRNFFNNSVDLVITALMKRKQSQLSPEQIKGLENLIEQARKEGR
jgi:BlaI family transcriptional regulator, penicillinase repressor